MKKIALCSLLVCLGVANAFAGTVTEACYATKNCGAKPNAEWMLGLAGAAAGTFNGFVLGGVFGPYGSMAGAIAGGYYGGKLGGEIGRDYSANEYIYFKDGSCLECDTHQVGEDYECPNGTVVTNGNVALVCRATGTGDYWTKYTIPVCNDSPVKPASASEYSKYKTVLRDNITNNGKVVSSGVAVFSGAVCLYVTGEKKEGDCPEGQRKATKSISIISNCEGTLCTPIVAGNCYPKDWLDCMERVDNGEQVVWNGKQCIGCNGDCNKRKKTCEEKYAGYPERIACCKYPESVTIWQGDLKTGKCVCVDKTKEWDGKQCKIKDDGVVIDDDDDDIELSDCYYEFKGVVNCANGAKFEQYSKWPIDKNVLKSKGITSCDQFKKQFTSDVSVVMEFFTNQCGSVVTNPVVDNTPTGPSDKDIESAQKNLKKFTESAKSNASVWKNAEGKFNTARLASDLTAGVVLGTVGGVVSGVVIKKKQVEKGFEALHCTVGGQKIADWGDQFTVGLQR